jgi:hypothetical protein
MWFIVIISINHVAILFVNMTFSILDEYYSSKRDSLTSLGQQLLVNFII